MDEYFSGEPIGQFYSFDSLPPQTILPGTPFAATTPPISPDPTLKASVVANGPNEEKSSSGEF